MAAVYEKKLPFFERILTRLFEILDPLMNLRINRKIIMFIIRHIKLGKVTKYLEGMPLSLGG